MKLKKPSIRAVNMCAFIACCLLLGFAAYLQVEAGQEPCPLCIVQRLVMAIMGLLFLVGATLHLRYRSRRIFHWFIAFVGFIGLCAAGRQIWLSHLPPDQVPPCGPGLYYTLQHLPLIESFKILVQGTAECAHVTWRFLTLSIPEWTFIFFALFMIVAIIQSTRKV